MPLKTSFVTADGFRRRVAFPFSCDAALPPTAVYFSFFYPTRNYSGHCEKAFCADEPISTQRIWGIASPLRGY